MYFTSFTRFKSQNPKQNHEIILNFEHFFSKMKIMFILKDIEINLKYFSRQNELKIKAL